MSEELVILINEYIDTIIHGYHEQPKYDNALTILIDFREWVRKKKRP